MRICCILNIEIISFRFMVIQARLYNSAYVSAYSKDSGIVSLSGRGMVELYNCMLLPTIILRLGWQWKELRTSVVCSSRRLEGSYIATEQGPEFGERFNIIYNLYVLQEPSCKGGPSNSRTVKHEPLHMRIQFEEEWKLPAESSLNSRTGYVSKPYTNVSGRGCLRSYSHWLFAQL